MFYGVRIGKLIHDDINSWVLLFGRILSQQCYGYINLQCKWASSLIGRIEYVFCVSKMSIFLYFRG